MACAAPELRWRAAAMFAVFRQLVQRALVGRGSKQHVGRGKGAWDFLVFRCCARRGERGREWQTDGADLWNGIPWLGSQRGAARMLVGGREYVWVSHMRVGDVSRRYKRFEEDRGSGWWSVGRPDNKAWERGSERGGLGMCMRVESSCVIQLWVSSR